MPERIMNIAYLRISEIMCVSVNHRVLFSYKHHSLDFGHLLVGPVHPHIEVCSPVSPNFKQTETQLYKLQTQTGDASIR